MSCEAKTKSPATAGSSRAARPDLASQAGRIQGLIDRIEALPDQEARELMAECLQEVLSLHGAALGRILEIAASADKGAGKAYDRLVDDGAVSGVLLIHGLHPRDLETRLRGALDRVLPYIHSHGGNIELAGIEDGVATIRLQGTCKSCPSSTVTLELAVKRAIVEACPDLIGLKVEGMAAQPVPRDPGAPPKTPDAAPAGWQVIEGLGELPDHGTKPVDNMGVPLIICRSNGTMYAYRNLCPSCKDRFESGTFDGETLRCRAGHAFDVRRAGLGVARQDLHLDPFPLLVEDGRIKVALAGAQWEIA
jgi:Fe-S cluster biogenesis protein NfuA/nitrite reductase/ring-hydroxylating ferredoxin subunit